MRDWSLRQRVARSSGALAALLIILFTTTGFALGDFISKGNDVVYRWQPAIDRSRTLLVDLVDEETGLRGYALTGQAGFLQPYTRGRTDEQTDVARLRQLIKPRPTLGNDLDTMQRAVDTWHAQTAQPVLARVASGDPNVAATLDAADDKARFDAVRNASNNLTQGIIGANRDARSLRAQAADILVAASVLTGVVVVAGSVLVWRSLHAWVLSPIDALAAQTRFVASGRANRAIRPVGPPEIEQLSRDVEAMRTRIADDLAIVERTRDELARSNADLEQFAYVASHDLSEPLRKVSNFCQLLERQYANELDERAKQYIGFAVDGAKRMQVLIEDLLALSRVGRTTDRFVPVDTGVALDQALANLEARIAESGAGVGRSDLPTVSGDPALLTALFENLVGNSIKYRGVDPPLIVVTAVRNPAVSGWEFAVRDNGIGIDPQYRERIFAIFQRLHLRDKYGGTGIGLALCRKIVEFHGGRIWLDSSAGAGATFRFTIPDGPTSERQT
ncbi:MAG TPA: ATP-binding protein [Jatrophihabitantaceae bacterium]|nr:ATP-binding protein [Jatrophihabitantaceae bacterium]